MEPGKDLHVVKKFHSLLVIEAQSPAEVFRNVAAKFEIIIADAKLILLSRRNDSLSAKTEAIELLKRACPRIRYSSAKKNPKALSSIQLVLETNTDRNCNKSPSCLKLF